MDEQQISYYFENPAACPIPFGNARFPWELLAEKNRFLESKRFEKQNEVFENVVMTGYVEIGENTVIEPFTVIEGPVIIGSDCLVRSGALLRPRTVIGNDVVIGHSAELKNALVFNEAKIQGQTFLGDSVIGQGVRMGTGVITGNRRFDQERIKIRIKDNVFELDTDKFGCIVGDFARIGMNVSIAPGVCIGKFSWVYPHVLVKDFLPKESFLKLQQETTVIGKEKAILKQTDIQGKI